MRIVPLSRSDMEANHARANGNGKKKKALPRTMRPWNVEIVLDLGNVVFFHFRGRAYGMPPLPWRAGQRLMALWLDATKFSAPLTEQTVDDYFKVVRQIPPILWKNCYPASRLLRLLRRFGMLRNPFARASEQEVLEYANFFLQRRMRSGVGFLAEKRQLTPNEETR